MGVDAGILPAFMASVLVILIAPGPDMMFMIGAGLSAGRRGAVTAAFGVTAGVSIYVVGSAVGLAAVVEAAPEVLNVIRLLGAVYLLHLGIDAWRSTRESVDPQLEADQGSQLFKRGFIVNVTNPKVVIFIAAFIPQFIDETQGNSRTQFLVLALTFQLLGLLVDLAVGLTAGAARQLLTNNANVMTRLDRLAGTVYIALALWLGVELIH